MINIQRFEVNPFGENTYIIWDPISREAAIIDPGMYNASEEQTIDRFIQAERLKLKMILLTHLHIDHTFGIDHIKLTYDVPVYANQEDDFLGQRRQEQARMFHMQDKLNPITIDEFINEGDVVTLGDEKILALHAPGHSPGSLLYYSPSSASLFSGDVLFQGSIGRTDLVGGNYGQLINSIHKKIISLPPSTTVYPGHGPATTIANELRSNPYF